MPEALSYSVHDAVPAADADVVDAGLDAHNHAAAPLGDVAPLACFVRGADGAVVGGVVGRTWGECCEMQQLWVAPAQRGGGTGTKLVQLFEAQARARGCRTFYLETFSFQARPFYERLGYAVELEIRGYAPGIAKFVMMRSEP